MKRILFAALALSLNFAYASAQETCESKAVSKDGRPLAGAAKASFLKKCKRDTCQPNAVDKNGKRLSAPLRRASCKSAKERRSNLRVGSPPAPSCLPQIQAEPAS